MTATTNVRIERTPTHHDLEIASMVHRALAAVQETGRFGDHKVFVSALWAMVRHLDAEAGGGLTAGCTLDHFKSWLLGGRHLTCDGSDDEAPLIVLARADLVAAMDYTVVAASEIVADGATFHFVLDPAIALDVYAPRQPTTRSYVGAGRVDAAPVVRQKRNNKGLSRRRELDERLIGAERRRTAGRS